MGEATGRVALVTGVSRRQGIGFAIAKRLLEDGLTVMLHSWAPHDAAQPWAPPAGELDAVITGLGGLGDRLGHVSADFADASAPREVIESVIERFGAIDVLIVNHARSSSGNLGEVTAEELDLSWAVNARASVLLLQAYAECHDDGRTDGRAGRWGQPDDIAKIVNWLVSPDAGWITGQVIDAEGGFRR
jgi:NAD(P)-dependent dehydrogenase (short-subunit alcohol dehydrogenase family)